MTEQQKQRKLLRKTLKAAKRAQREKAFRARRQNQATWEWREGTGLFARSLRHRNGTMRFGLCGDYIVGVMRFPDGTALLTINDPLRRHNWQDMQRIKNQVLGEDWAGVEVFPRQELVVDEADLYHLWCTPEQLRIGWDDGGEFTVEHTFCNGPVDARKADAGQLTSQVAKPTEWTAEPAGPQQLGA